MLYNLYKYWDSESCNDFIKKSNFETAVSIQLFNKHSQWGILTNSELEKGKLYIIYLYSLSNKHKLRKNFKYNSIENDKNVEIEKIKSTIKDDYLFFDTLTKMQLLRKLDKILTSKEIKLTDEQI